MWTDLIAAGLNEETSLSTGAWDLIWNSGPVVQFVLVILVFFSVTSWAIIIFKFIALKKIKLYSTEFLDNFFKKETLDSMHVLSQDYNFSPEAAIFDSSYSEMRKCAQKNNHFKFDLENIERAMNKAHISEINKLEGYVPFLATTASACPLIGLFGTVWGIMNSFQAIGARGSANLATVAPGISEALISTAIGLAAAIPAVIFYNFFINKIKKHNAGMKNFKVDLLNIIKRNF